MQNQKSPILSTCPWTEADIALFPLVEKPVFEYEKILPKHILKQNVVGVSNLPPYFANRLDFFNENGKTFFAKNVPLVFSLLAPTDIEREPISEYWSQLMMVARKGVCPRIWAIAPELVCKYIMSNCVGETNGFYYHEPKQVENHYYAITNAGQMKTHLLFSTPA
ncbi:MAG: hypothetical protein AAB966_00680 [Patescibacteria group bacterium]